MLLSFCPRRNRYQSMNCRILYYCSNREVRAHSQYLLLYLMSQQFRLQALSALMKAWLPPQLAGQYRHHKYDL